MLRDDHHFFGCLDEKDRPVALIDVDVGHAAGPTALASLRLPAGRIGATRTSTALPFGSRADTLRRVRPKNEDARQEPHAQSMCQDGPRWSSTFVALRTVVPSINQTPT